MRERITKFMSGRNGNDALNRFLLLLDLLLLLLSALIKGTVSLLLYPLILLLLGFTYYRMLSRDLWRRADENRRYLEKKERLAASLRLLKERWTQRKDYKFFYCPACRAVMRVPRGRGKIRIVCRKCGNSFTGKS